VKNLPLLVCLWFLLPSLTELQRFLFPFDSFLPFLITSPQLSSSFSVTKKTTSYKSVFNNFLFMINTACSARHVRLRLPTLRVSGALYSLRACLRLPEKREKNIASSASYDKHCCWIQKLTAHQNRVGFNLRQRLRNTSKFPWQAAKQV